MLTLVQSIEFKNTNCDFQQQLSRDIRKIQKDKKLIIPADKTTNFYCVNPASFKQLLQTNITKSYKKALTNQTSKVIAEEKKRPILGPNVAAIICEIRRYWAILEKIFKIHGDIKRYWAILGDTGRY